jgi:hypothetical protein
MDEPEENASLGNCPLETSVDPRLTTQGRCTVEPCNA